MGASTKLPATDVGRSEQVSYKAESVRLSVNQTVCLQVEGRFRRVKKKSFGCHNSGNLKSTLGTCFQPLLSAFHLTSKRFL